MNENEIPEKYKTCDWLWNYGSIGLTKEHIKRLNNAINILESLNEHTDVKYLKEIKDKLLEDIPEIKSEQTNTDAFIEKAAEWFRTHWRDYVGIDKDNVIHFGLWGNDFKNYMKGEHDELV